MPWSPFSLTQERCSLDYFDETLIIRRPDVHHESPVEPVYKHFPLWSSKLDQEASRRIQWINCTSHRKLWEDDQPEELQPDGSVQSCLKKGPDEDKHLMFVVEVANSQSFTAVRQKLGKWIFGHGVRTGLIIKVILQENPGAHAKDTLSLSFELWRVREVDFATFASFCLKGKPIKEGSDIWYNKKMGIMWIPVTVQGGVVVYTTLSQSGGAFDVTKVRNPSA
jgi:hypothetical protein